MLTGLLNIEKLTVSQSTSTLLKVLLEGTVLD